MRWMCRDREVPSTWCWFAGVCSPVVNSSGLPGGPYGPGRPCLVAVVVPTSLVSRQGCCFGMSVRVVVVLLALLWLVRHRLRRSMTGLSCPWTRWVVAVLYGRFRLFQLRGAGTVRCGGALPPHGRAGPQGKRGSDNWYDRVRKGLKFGTTRPVLPCRHLHTHNSSPVISQYPSAVFSAALVPIIYTPPSVARPSQSLLLGASPCSPREPQGVAPARWCGARARVCLPVVCRMMPCLAGSVGGVPMP